MGRQKKGLANAKPLWINTNLKVSLLNGRIAWNRTAFVLQNP